MPSRSPSQIHRAPGPRTARGSGSCRHRPDGPHACPKGLRHGFGVQAVSRGIALNMVQKWLGHAQFTTTAIYANAVGEEEQSIAARMW
jgi:integrase